MSKQTDQREKEMAGFDHQIIEASPSGMILVDARADDMPIVYVNAAFETLTGHSRVEAIGRNSRFLQGDDRDQTDLDIVRDAIKNKKACTVTLRNYRKDGTFFWNELRISPIFDADGEVTHFVGVQNDVTEREQANAYLQTILDSSLNGVMAFEAIRDESGQIIDFRWTQVNHQAEKLVGRTQEELLGKQLLVEMPGNRDEGLFELYVKVVESSQPLNHEHYYEHEGIKTWFRTTAVKLEDGFVVTFADITESKRIEKELRIREKRHRLTLQGTRAGTWEWNIQTGETVFNDRWAHIVGYTLEELAPINIQTWINLTHPDDLQRSNTLLEKHFAGESDYYECEVRMKHKDGHWVWVLDRGTVMEWDAEGKPILMFGTHVEITERKQAEDVLRESEARYRLLAQNITDMISTHDLDGVYTFASPSCESLLGYTPEELVGRSAYELFHPDDLAAIRSSHQTIQTTPDRSKVEYRIRHKSGHYVWFETTSRVVRDETTDQPHMIITVSRDITERVQMQEALRQSEREFRNLTEKSPDLIVRIDRDSTHLYVNPAFAKAIGLPAEEIVGKTNADLGVPEEAERELSAIREQIYETGKATEMELDYVVNGVLRSYHLRLTPELDADGNVKAIISVSRDITDRKHAQQRKFDLELERERRRLLTSFIQNAAHEFRTPLATINSSAYIMSRSENSEQRVQKAQQVENHIRRITKLIDMQLMMSKLESSNSISPSSVDISAVIQQVWQEMREEYGNIHEMRQELSSDLSIVPGNADYLAEALKQIIENACRFTPEGGTVTVSARTVGEQVQVEVEDTGPGIPQDKRSRIFETFWRQDAAHSTPGFGLGLPIAQRIIERHGGEIAVDSDPGHGTCIRVTLPTTLTNINSQN